MSYNDNVMECWQSGNAPDSKSGEPSFPWRAGSNPVHSSFELNLCKAAIFIVAFFFLPLTNPWDQK